MKFTKQETIPKYIFENTGTSIAVRTLPLLSVIHNSQYTFRYVCKLVNYAIARFVGSLPLVECVRHTTRTRSIL